MFELKWNICEVLLTTHLSEVMCMFVVMVRKLQFQAYLPGTGFTVIRKAVGPGRDLSIALRLG